MGGHLENVTKIKRSIFWKIYFCFFVSQNVISKIAFYDNEGERLIFFIDIYMSLIIAVGLFGYVFSKRIYQRSFWFTFFWIFMVYSLDYPFLEEIFFMLPYDTDLTRPMNCQIARVV